MERVSGAQWCRDVALVGGLGECLHSGPTPRGREGSTPRTKATVVLKSTSASRCRILVVRKEMERIAEFGA